MGKYKCECGYENDHNGAFNLHKYHCNLRKAAGVEKQKKKQQPCEHEWRLLTRENVLENNAINQGYREVCEKCQSVQ